MTDAERLDLKDKLLMADLTLKTKQAFWETPRNIVLIVTAAAGISGLLGYKLGSAPQTITVHLDAPLTIQPANPASR
jgi:hypothetical protein